MRILSIETSCDETAVAVLEGSPTSSNIGNAANFAVLGNALLSQIDIHKEYGGVYPMVAKREHAKNLVPLLGAALEEAGALVPSGRLLPEDVLVSVRSLLEREPGLTDAFLTFVTSNEPPLLDAIAVTAGPGLEPALWVGVNFAKALSLVWDVPIVSVNHMEGHICAALAQIDGTALSVSQTALPLLALLISGGHTELVLAKEWLSYELIGATRDDAVGEAFDKVARMLGLPYPGGPEVSELAEQARSKTNASGTTVKNPFKLPRPMINDPHNDFSFSGLKTAVLYAVKDIVTKNGELTDTDKENLAWAFEDAAADVLYAKTARAIEQSGAKTLALGGGVSANIHIQRTFRERIAHDFPDVHLAIPTPALTTDNAIMIGLAGYYHALTHDFIDPDALRADGNRTLSVPS